MKKLFPLFVALITLLSCGENDSYYDQITKTKPILERVNDLNKSMTDIRKMEKVKLFQEDVDYMEYEYKIGTNDTYIVSYLFDEKGCYEVGFDGYFEKGENAKLVLDGFKKEVSASAFGEPEETPRLVRWLNPNQSVTIELDYTDVDNGMTVVTIFANE